MEQERIFIIEFTFCDTSEGINKCIEHAPDKFRGLFEDFEFIADYVFGNVIAENYEQALEYGCRKLANKIDEEITAVIDEAYSYRVLYNREEFKVLLTDHENENLIYNLEIFKLTDLKCYEIA